MKRSVLLIAILVASYATAADLKVTYRTIRNDKKGLWTSSVRYPQFSGTSALAKLANKTMRAEAQAFLKDFAKSSREALQDYKSDREYAAEWTPTISLATDHLISLSFAGYQDMGGAHPSHFYTSYAFGYVNGKAKELKLQDLFLQGTKPNEVCSPPVLKRLRARQASNVMDDTIKVLEPSYFDIFVITKSAITFLFAPYDVASYAEGSFDAKVPFAELRSSLNSKGPLKKLLGKS